MTKASAPKPAGVAAGKPFRPAALLQFADQAIVSRVLAKNDHCNLTLFAFDAGQGLTEHVSPFDAYVFLLEGELELTVGGGRTRPAPGEAVLMPAQVPHALHAVQPSKMLLVMVRTQVS